MLAVTRRPLMGRLLARLIPGLLLLGLVGCSSVTLVSRYDEQTDRSVTEFGKKVDAFLVKLDRDRGKPEASYKKNLAFYDDAHVDVRAMQVRARAIPQNDLTVQQLDLLSQSLDDLEARHKLSNPIGPDEIALIRQGFETTCGAILKLEIAKKRGEKPGAATP